MANTETGRLADGEMILFVLQSNPNPNLMVLKGMEEELRLMKNSVKLILEKEIGDERVFQWLSESRLLVLKVRRFVDKVEESEKKIPKSRWFDCIGRYHKSKLQHKEMVDAFKSELVNQIKRLETFGIAHLNLEETPISPDRTPSQYAARYLLKVIPPRPQEELEE